MREGRHKSKQNRKPWKKIDDLVTVGFGRLELICAMPKYWSSGSPWAQQDIKHIRLGLRSHHKISYSIEFWKTQTDGTLVRAHSVAWRRCTSVTWKASCICVVYFRIWRFYTANLNEAIQLMYTRSLHWKLHTQNKFMAFYAYTYWWSLLTMAWS